MKFYIVTEPNSASPNVIEIELVKFYYNLVKKFLTDKGLPNLDVGTEEPSRMTLDVRDVNESIEITGHLSSFSDFTTLRENTRTYMDNTYGAACDVFFMSNDGAIKTSYDKNSPYSSTPTNKVLEWRIETDGGSATTSGGAHITRFRGLFAPSAIDLDGTDDQSLLRIQMTLQRTTIVQ